jgi:tetratricopeptide (TPR) repeat protein
VLSRADVVNERHAYLADAGLFVAAGAIFGRLLASAPRPRPLLAGGALLTGALLAFTTARDEDSATETALWESTVRVSPANPRAHANLGNAFEREGRLAEARAEYLRALALEPRYEPARRKLARTEEAVAGGRTAGEVSARSAGATCDRCPRVTAKHSHLLNPGRSVARHNATGQSPGRRVRIAPAPG